MSSAALSEVGKSSIRVQLLAGGQAFASETFRSKASTAGACWDSEVFQSPLHLAKPAVHTWSKLYLGDIRRASENKPMHTP